MTPVEVIKSKIVVQWTRASLFHFDSCMFGSVAAPLIPQRMFDRDIDLPIQDHPFLGPPIRPD